MTATAHPAPRHAADAPAPQPSADAASAAVHDGEALLEPLQDGALRIEEAFALEDLHEFRSQVARRRAELEAALTTARTATDSPAVAGAEEAASNEALGALVAAALAELQQIERDHRAAVAAIEVAARREADRITSAAKQEADRLRRSAAAVDRLVQPEGTGPTAAAVPGADPSLQR